MSLCYRPLISVTDRTIRMSSQRQLIVPALAAGLLSAALAGCGGAGAPQGTSATSRAATSAKPTVPTTLAQVQARLYSVLNGVKSMHVKATYTWPHFKLTADVGMLQSGQMAGFVDDDGLPMSMIDAGGKMYVKVTPALAAYYHRQADCATLCGKYAIYPRSPAAGLIRSMGWKWTWNTLMQMADFVSAPVRTTFHGQPALQAAAPGFHRGAYVILTASPDPCCWRPSTHISSR